MTSTHRSLLVSIVLFALTADFGVSQKQSTDRDIFDQGIIAYNFGNFTKAAEIFESAMRAYPKSPIQTSFHLMLCKSLLRSELYSSALYQGDAFLQQHPKSNYVGAVYYNNAETFFRLGKKMDACRQLLKMRQSGVNENWFDYAGRKLEMMFTTQVRGPQILHLADTAPDEVSRQWILLKYAEKQMSLGRKANALETLKKLIDPDVDRAVKKDALDHYRAVQSMREAPVRIGLVISLSGSYRALGESVKRGIDLAIEEYNKINEPAIELVVYDDRSDVIATIKAVRDLVNDHSVSAIIGPIESNAMASASLIANSHAIPIISPTANKSGLTDIGPYVFQANIDLAGRCSAMVSYMIKKRGMQTFAVLAPIDYYGDTMTEAFTRSVEKQGGKIITVQRYYEGTQDFRNQFLNMRKLGFIEASHLKGKFAYSNLTSRQIDSLYKMIFVEEEGEKPNLRPVTHIDAVFFPIYKDEIKYIAPQLAFYNIKTQPLGGDYWFDQTELSLHNSYIGRVIFFSEFFVTAGHENNQYRKSFTQKYGQEPGRESYYGYDLIQLIGSLVSQGNRTSDEIAKALNEGVTWKGLHNQIVLSKKARMNSSVHLLQYTDKIIRIWPE